MTVLTSPLVTQDSLISTNIAIHLLLLFFVGLNDILDLAILCYKCPAVPDQAGAWQGILQTSWGQKSCFSPFSGSQIQFRCVSYVRDLFRRAQYPTFQQRKTMLKGLPPQKKTVHMKIPLLYRRRKCRVVVHI